MTRLFIHVLLINAVVGLVLMVVFTSIADKRYPGISHKVLREDLGTKRDPIERLGGDKSPLSLKTDPIPRGKQRQLLRDYGNIRAIADIAIGLLEAESRRASRGRWLFYIATGALMANGLLLVALVRIGEVAEAKAQTSSEEGTNA